MSLPDRIESMIDGESVIARVSLGGEDELIVSPTSTVQYHAESLLSDESVEEFPHDAERVSVSTGRRKATITLDYGLDGERTLTVPSDRVDDALHPVLAGVLAAAGVTDPGETAIETFRFNELTVVVTDSRVIEHVGTAVWDADHEVFPFADVTGVTAEEGSVATQFAITVAGRPRRIKIPNERARAFEECVRSALREYHGVESIGDLGSREEDDDTDGSDERESDPSEGDVTADVDVEARLDALAATVENQRSLLADQQRAIERLREELSPDQ